MRITRYRDGVQSGWFEVAILAARPLNGTNSQAVVEPFSPYRNLPHFVAFRSSTRAQMANDEPPNLPGVGTKW